MFITLIVDKFFPEVGAAAVQYYELGRELAKMGHRVLVITTTPRYIDESIRRKYVRDSSNAFVFEELESMKVLRIPVKEIDKSKIFYRAIEQFMLTRKMVKILKFLLKKREIPDVLLIYTPPLPQFKVGVFMLKKVGVPYVLNVQDLFPKEAVQMGILRNPIFIKYFEKMEKTAYDFAASIVVHSENNASHIKRIIPEKKIFIIENWVDPERIKPGQKINEFSLKYGLKDKFVVSFAGTIGFAQDVKSIVEAAKMLEDYKDIVFIIVGEGARKKEVEKLIEDYRLNNLKLLPPVSPDKYAEVLHASDVSLATLVKDLRTPVVPSKITSIMSAGIPVIACLDESSDAHVLISKARCGFSYPAERPDLLAEGILQLYRNETLRKQLGENGRKYVVENLSVQVAAQKFLKVFEQSVSGRLG